ncbi:methylated-DNA--[protein]-cysteine S-methyltransferase [Opitutus terrae]|uniref:methylated-DNA--[protein]-cysteine S-methyltransferase n=1 Tax=Opitutus terrae (strain DSM 11246 / JCM 15787 / PB90-1) TaxID=452637 RepID=B1ZV81_OPITP|nr:methylated-DNA--[protein]-cysteine S-methyltransferase [Opitutus terrae]ACB76748.1 methylated-DNA--protein-cysteine methyltransferase [Opitutus terrae PB90-1]
MSSIFYDTFTTPFGDFSAAVDDAGNVVATAFGDLAALRQRLRSSRRCSLAGRGVPAEPAVSAAHRDGSPYRSLARNPAVHAAGHEMSRDAEWVSDQHRTGAVREQVGEYCGGARQEFDLPLAPTGSAFQQRVWTALRAIPFGTTCSYAQLAARLGLSGGARAIGGANAANPICLIVPCHRIIGSNGALTGFAFGEERKRALLEHERAATLAASRAPAVPQAACRA